MNISLARAGGMLALIGGIASLIGFVFLPFGVNPLTFAPQNGIQLLQFYAQQASENGNLYGSGQTDHLIYDLFILSYASLGALLVIFVLLTLLAFFLVILRKSSIALPIACLVLCLFAVPGLFLAFSQFANSTDAGNLLHQMFASGFPIIRVGWWVSLGGVFLTLVAGLLVIRGRSLASRP